jgi:hypothetical protein
MNKLLTVPPQCPSLDIPPRGKRPMIAINPATDNGVNRRIPRRFN